MNPIESILYPDSYFHDISSFLTNFTTRTFSKRPSLQPTAEFIAPTSDDGELHSDFERLLHLIITRAVCGSGLDESVAIGTAVLLDLLNNLSISTQTRPRRLYHLRAHPKLILPPYPSSAYIQYFIGAFMLSYRLLSRDRPVLPRYWETVFSELGDSEVYSAKELAGMEDAFRGMLEGHINAYVAPSESPEEREMQMRYMRTCLNTVPANAYIAPLRFIKMKSAMYAYVEGDMVRRGEMSLEEKRTRALEVGMQVQPCFNEMMRRMEMFEAKEREVPDLVSKEDRPLFDYVLTTRIERTLEEMEKPPSGSIVFLFYATGMHVILLLFLVERTESATLNTPLSLSSSLSYHHRTSITNDALDPSLSTHSTPNTPHDPSMPPTPGIFPVPYGTAAASSHLNQGVITGGGGQLAQVGHAHSHGAQAHAVGVIGGGGGGGHAQNHVIGPGVPGPGSNPSSHVSHNHIHNHLQTQTHQHNKATRSGMNGSAGDGFGGQTQEVYGPGIGHGLHAQHGHIGYGHGHAGHQPLAGPSSRHPTSGAMEESMSRKEKRKKESSKHKDTSDRRDDSGRHFTESISALHNAAHILSTRPELSAHFQLRLYPLSLERSSLLSQFEAEERYAVELAQVAYEEERERVEEEWKKGREKVRERLLEGIEERRRRAREEKEGEGTVGDASLDSHSRPPVTRKLRNKLGTSPPPTPQNGVNGSGTTSALHNGGFGASHPLAASYAANALSSANLPITTGPFLNPHSLNVDDLPSPFPLPLTSTSASQAGGVGASGPGGANGAGGPGAGVGGTGPNGGRRRVKGGAGHAGQALGGLGKSLAVFGIQKESMEIENDLNEIKRGNKRRRAAAVGGMKM